MKPTRDAIATVVRNIDAHVRAQRARTWVRPAPAKPATQVWPAPMRETPAHLVRKWGETAMIDGTALRVKAEYDRERAVYVRNLRHLAQTALDEAEVMEKMGYHPSGLVDTFMRDLLRSRDRLSALQPFYPAE